MLGIMSFDIEGIIGTLLIMLGHGIVSGGLFFAIGILYDRFKTKIYYYYSGLVVSMPIFSVCFFLLILGNVSLPLTCNFIGEVLILHKAITEFHILISLSIYISIFICTAYSF
jgi:NADH-quinone oxidoreductase subunit M